MKQKFIKRTARALMALLVVTIAICFVPQMSMKAFAAETSYLLWVGNTQVTDENMDDILGDGTASFDPGSNTLTLDGTTIKEPYSDGPDSLSACIYTKMDKLVIQGSATMENNSEPAKHALGINASGCDLELNGTFNIKSGNCGIIAYDITFSGGKTTVESGAGYMGGIDGGNIEVKGGIVISTSEMCGMAASESITIGADMAIAEPFDGKVFKDSDHNYAIITDAKGNAASTVLIAPKSEVAEVTFDDGQGTTLKVENVLKGTAATAPEEPTREGYLFGGWDKDFSNVTENMTVSAKWGDPYPVWVGKTQASSVNKDDILGDGTASFDPDSNTLTLNGATIKEPYSAGPNSWSACIHTKLEKLIIKGSATMENNSEPSRDALGIYAANSALELDGTFNIKCGYYSISAKDITFSGGEITAKSDSGIQGTNIEVKGGILTSTGNAYGMYATDSLTIGSDLMIVEPFGGKVVKGSQESQVTIKDAKGNDSKAIVIAPKSEVAQVKFVDGQGKTLKTQNVIKGKAATAPDEPSREGYTFNGWDTDFSNVTSDLTVTAKWKQNLVTYKVTFEDGLGKILDTQTVVSGRPATAPSEPTRDGYLFSGWDKDFSNVTSDLTVKAVWTKVAPAEDKCTVVFVPGFGNDPVTRVVEKGGSAKAPELPAVDGFTFTGWDKDFTNVTDNLTVTAQWKRNTADEAYTVTFVNGYLEAPVPIAIIRVKYGQAANPPAEPTREGYTFDGWDTDFSYVTENLTVIAQWKQNAPSPSKPVSIANAKVVLSALSFAYNGKVRKPSIKTVNGKALKSGTDYTVKWSNTSSKNVGSYTVTITGKGNYTGVTKVTYKINPKGTSLKKPKKAKKAITVKWKRQSAKMSKSRITGYQIQLATDKKFTKNRKTVNVKGYKKVSRKVKRLKAKKKYYIRIRTYKTVSGKNYYSGWSKVKTAKTR